VERIGLNLRKSLEKYEEIRIWLQLQESGRVLDRAGRKLCNIRIESPIGGLEDTLTLTVSDKDAEFALASTRPFGTRAEQQWTQQSMSSSNLPMPTREMFNPIKQIGTLLFESLFEGKRETLYRRCLEYSKEQGTGLRLRLLFSDPELEALPWEFLHDGEDFVNLSTMLHVVRTPSSIQLSSPKPASKRLRILAVACEPYEGALGAKKDLDFLQTLTQSFPQLELHTLYQCSPASLIGKVASLDFEVFHFSGTGIINVRGNQDELFLTDNKSNAEINWRLARELQKKSELQLILFSACHTGRIAKDFAETDQTCTIGISSVISDVACVAFVDGFYNEILIGGSLEVAVAKGRQKMVMHNPGGNEWGLPIFYMPTVSSPFFIQVPEINFEKRLARAPKTLETVTLSPDVQREQEKLYRQLELTHTNLNALEAIKASYKGKVPKSIESQISESQKKQQELNMRLNEIASSQSKQREVP
jgi:hypothetical protein